MIKRLMFTQTTGPKIRSEPQLQKYCNFCQKYKHSVSNFFRKQRVDEEENGIHFPDRNHLFNLQL